MVNEEEKELPIKDKSNEQNAFDEPLVATNLPSSIFDDAQRSIKVSPNDSLVISQISQNL